MVVGVRHRFEMLDLFSSDHIAQEEDMRTQIELLFDLNGEMSADLLRDVGDSL